VTLDSELFQGLADIRLALRRFVAASEVLSRSGGITQQQYQALLAIKTWPYQTMQIKDLAEQLLCTHHAAVQLIDRLSKLDLVKRQQSEEDRRAVILKLTESGEATLNDLALKHVEEMLRHEPLLTASLRRLRRIKD
jgi:DNA-binding MarR family transcriptional regulator